VGIFNSGTRTIEMMEGVVKSGRVTLHLAKAHVLRGRQQRWASSWQPRVLAPLELVRTNPTVLLYRSPPHFALLFREFFSSFGPYDK
jgi:hypothetical protein